MTHTPLDCEKRGTTTAKQIAECSYDNDHREAQTNCTEGGAADARNPCDIDAVHNIVQQAQYLRCQHRNRCVDNIAGDSTVFKIYLFHISHQTFQKVCQC